MQNANKKEWWKAVVNEAEQKVDVFIFDEIGWDTTAKEFIMKVHGLAQDKKDLVVHINSPGGSVFEGLAIFHFLKSLDVKVTTIVEGFAASIAAVVVQAGEERIIPENAMMMIHNAWNITLGEADDMREMADFLDKVDEQIAGVFVKATGKTEEEIKELMDAETWMNGEEAVEMGFATTMSNAVKVAASFDVAKLKNMPKDVANRLAQQKEEGKAMDAKELQTKLDELQAKSEADAKAAESKIKASFDEGVTQGEEQALGRIKGRMDKYADASFVLETIELSDDEVKDKHIEKLEADNKAKAEAIKKLSEQEPGEPPVKTKGSGNEPEPKGGTPTDPKAEKDAKLKARKEELVKEGKSVEDAWKQAHNELD